jgi:hypothetical protein
VTGSNELDFFSQLFSQAAWLPLSIVFLGGLYVFMMVIIFRRAAERRRRALSQMQSAQPALRTAAPALSRLGRFLQVSRLPEPDLDLLIGGATPPKRLETPSSAPAPELPITLPVAVTPEERMPIPEMLENEPVSLPEDAVEVMRIWRDISDGSLIIQIGDKYYRHAAAIGNPDQKRRFEAVVRTLSAMIAAPVAPPKPLSTPSAPPLSAPSPEPPKRGLFGKPKPAEPEPSGGIADQIEEFLQARLLNSPFSTRSIHIRPAPDHGVRIEVDGHFYDSIAEVIDPDVREYLTNIMREWEARH